MLAALLVVTGSVTSEPARLAPYAADVLALPAPKNSMGFQRQRAEVSSYLFTQPVTVGLDAASRKDPLLRQGITEAVSTWNSAMPDVPLTLADGRQTPSVVVHWVESLDPLGDIQGEIKAGRKWSWGDRAAYNLNVDISVRRMVNGRVLTQLETTQVITHELGHLIGLDDVRRTDGVMGPLVVGSPRLQPSPDEIAVLSDYRAALRSFVARRLR